MLVCLFSIYNTISLSRHEQVRLSGLRFQGDFSHDRVYISPNVAQLNILFHDMINVLYYYKFLKISVFHPKITLSGKISWAWNKTKMIFDFSCRDSKEKLYHFSTVVFHKNIASFDWLSKEFIFSIIFCCQEMAISNSDSESWFSELAVFYTRNYIQQRISSFKKNKKKHIKHIWKFY